MTAPSEAELIRAAGQILAACRDQSLKIVTAESCTGGMIATMLTEVPGSSDVFERGFVTYSNEAKEELIGVPVRLIEDFGAVSEEVARAMAVGALAASEAQLSVSVTGVAGPGGGSPEKPVGLVHLAAARGNKVLHERCEFGDPGRNEIRRLSVARGFVLLNSLL